MVSDMPSKVIARDPAPLISGWDWKGDMDDDCTAVGRGLMLRAEQMGRKHWWWAVYGKSGARGAPQIAASYDNENNHARTGREARILAERAAWHFLYFAD
jgi:hypothetical protein